MGYDVIYRISTDDPAANLERPQIWDGRTTGLNSRGITRKEKDGVSGSILTNLTKLDSKDEVDSADYTHGSSNAAQMGALPVIRNGLKKNSIYNNQASISGRFSPN